MSDTLKLEYKIGAIEFKAEGPSAAVEQQRINFVNVVLPAAIEAMARTQAQQVQPQLISDVPQTPLLETGEQIETNATQVIPDNDLSRSSLTSFLKPYGILSDQDFALFAAYFDEKKNGKTAFSSDSVKQYYLDARRTAYSNNSMLLNQLAKKGLIMDAPSPEEGKSGKYYMLTDTGIKYIEEYIPRENNVEKKSHAKARKTTNKVQSAYASVNADDLNVGNYPSVKTLAGPKERVIMAMYIVTNENKGEWFTVDDVIYLLVNIFEVPADPDKVNGVFKRNKSMFASTQDEQNKKALRHKLLSGAKDFAKTLIEGNK